MCLLTSSALAVAFGTAKIAQNVALSAPTMCVQPETAVRGLNSLPCPVHCL